MEKGLTPATAQKVGLPPWWRPDKRDRAIREHFAVLGVPASPRGKFVLRCELVGAVNAYYVRLAAPALRVEVLTDFVPAQPEPPLNPTIINQGEING